MTLQISKDKSVDIKLSSLLPALGGGGGGGSSRALKDVTGIELGGNDPRGCPAVRLQRAGSGWRLKAFGYVKPPEPYQAGSDKVTPWTLPQQFRSPSAAIALRGEGVYAHQSAYDGAEPVPKGVRTENDVRESSLALGREARLDVGAPYGMVRWAVRLLPEGFSPTVASVQAASIAEVAALKAMQGFDSKADVQLAMMLGEDQTRIVGFRRGSLALLRTCTDAISVSEIEKAAAESLGMDVSAAEELMEEGVIDPGEGFSDLIRPLLRQLGISRDFLGAGDAPVRLTGLSGGFPVWKRLALEEAGVTLVSGSIFDGVKADDRLAEELRSLSPGEARGFIAALGAAVASMETKGEDSPLHLNLMLASERFSSSPLRMRFILPIATGFILVCMLAWWGAMAARLGINKMYEKQATEQRDQLKDAYDKIVKINNDREDLRGHILEFEEFARSRRRYGALLARVAENIPSEMQLKSLDICCRPEAQHFGATPGLVAAVDSETPYLTVAGNVAGANLIDGFLGDMETTDAGRSLVIDSTAENPAERSPRVIKFDQFQGGFAIGGNAGGRRRRQASGDSYNEAMSRRLLTFELEFRLRDRRFVK